MNVRLLSTSKNCGGSRKYSMSFLKTELAESLYQLTAVLLTSKKRWKMITKTQMKTICILVIVMNVISVITCVIRKDWTNAFNNVALALSWGIILKIGQL